MFLQGPPENIGQPMNFETYLEALMAFSKHPSQVCRHLPGTLMLLVCVSVCLSVYVYVLVCVCVLLFFWRGLKNNFCSLHDIECGILL